jgi:hypothetical protein
VLLVLLRQIERMMGDDDFDHVIAEGAEPLLSVGDLCGIDASPFDRQGTGRVKA